MNTDSKLKYILVFSLGLSACATLGHDVPVHRLITANAAESALNDSSAYAGFISTVSSDCDLTTATSYMILGSAREDAPVAGIPLDAGGYRSINHFYDPLDTTYGKGLSDSPPDRRLLIATNSFAWGSISNCLGYNFSGVFGFIGQNVGTSNTWSWPNARGYEWLGLTAASKASRFAALTNMFRAVGQVMHLLEDTTQPQHVRNEQHLEGTIWQSPIEDYGLANVTNLNYTQNMLDWRDAGFTKLEDFWDRHLYAPGSATVLQSAETGGAQLGLAEWCNGNFLGDRHLFPEYYDSGDIAYYPYPSRDHSTDYNTVKASPLSGLHPLAPKNGPGNGIYLHKTTDGVNIQYLSRVNYLGAKLPNANLKGVPYCTIRDDNVLSNYHNIFIPKAVEYSAGLLDYYFRGNIATSLTQDTNSQYIFGITNTSGSGQDFGGGNFYLVSEDSSGVRTIVQTNQLIGTLPSGSSTNIAYPGNVTNKMLVIYRGTIGTTSGTTNALDPVDAGIGLAAAYGESCDCAGSPTDLNNLVWTIIDSSNDGAITITPSSPTGASFSFSGSESDFYSPPRYIVLHSTICNPTSSDITIHENIQGFSWEGAALVSSFPSVDSYSYEGFSGNMFLANSSDSVRNPLTQVDVIIPAMNSIEINFLIDVATQNDGSASHISGTIVLSL